MLPAAIMPASTGWRRSRCTCCPPFSRDAASAERSAGPARAPLRGLRVAAKQSGAELRPALAELLLQARDDARVHLADPRLAQIERGADLLHRHVFVVVENDDEPFVA